MEFLNINRILLGIIAVIVIAAAIFMIVVPLLDQPAVADQSAAPTIVPQQPSLDPWVVFASALECYARSPRTSARFAETCIMRPSPGARAALSRGERAIPLGTPPSGGPSRHRFHYRAPGARVKRA